MAVPRMSARSAGAGALRARRKFLRFFPGGFRDETGFPFIALPEEHVFLKPNVTRIAARVYGFDFHYRSRPSPDTYRSLLDFAARVARDVRDLRPRDMIDVQSFLWVQGSDEYAE